MRDLIKLELPEDVWARIRELYSRMGWEGDAGEYITFEDACALYMRLKFHRTVLPDHQARAVTGMLLHSIRRHLEDEVSTDPPAPPT